MGGFFGAASRRDVVLDVFFGVDYHSHLGTRRAGMVFCEGTGGFQKEIHSIENTPFRTKFEHDLPALSGTCGVGCIIGNNGYIWVTDKLRRIRSKGRGSRRIRR